MNNTDLDDLISKRQNVLEVASRLSRLLQERKDVLKDANNMLCDIVLDAVKNDEFLSKEWHQLNDAYLKLYEITKK